MAYQSKVNCHCFVGQRNDKIWPLLSWWTLYHCVVFTFVRVFLYLFLHFVVFHSFYPKKHEGKKKKKEKKPNQVPVVMMRRPEQFLQDMIVKILQNTGFVFLNMCLIIFNVDQLHCIWHKAFSSRYCNAWQKELTVLSLKVGRPYLCIKKSS